MKTIPYKQFREKLAVRGYAVRSIDTYVRTVTKLAEHCQRSPDKITDDELHQYFAYLLGEKKYSRNTMVGIICGLRIFYRIELRRSTECLAHILPIMKTPVRLPRFYSVEEVQRLLTVKGLRMKQITMLITTYATGLRVREVCRLKVTDILSSRLQIHVEQGKGDKERYTVLSPKLLNILRNYWRVYRPAGWLFPNPVNPEKPLNPTSLYRTFTCALKLAGLPNRGGIHSLRHSFATHAFESGVDLPTLQSLLGHRWLITTTVYLHASQSRMLQARSPLDLLDFNSTLKAIETKTCSNNLHDSEHENWATEEPG